ncbi:hypothetical protein GWK47_047473 [Chionoecetes opilio]|uniref:CCHC-type domain-containing protein n=1 Tax=Chionoecetes opilio TaxID=41210 RepID=A0A8J4YBY2_CHIOP|nr:hypothetical protein GWK47_047473 [Chionoecetes opilio]
MAQYLQGLMEEGMGGVETPPAGSGRAGRAAWVHLRHTTTPRVYTPSPDITPATQQQLWPTTQQHRPPPSSRPGERTVGMSPATFEAWATSVEDYSSICGWAAPTAAPYVRLLCNTEVQQRIDARLGKQVFRQLSTTEAIDVVRSVVIGTRCIIGARAEFFSLAQASSNSVCAYISQCRAKANECSFRCPECQCHLEEYMLSKKIVMGLRDRNMKAGVLRCFPRLESFSEIVRVCEIFEAAEKASDQPSSYVASVGVGDTLPPPVMVPHHEVAAAGPARRLSGQGKTRQDGVRRGRRRCPACGESECTGGRQCRAFAATCRCCGQKGHFWRLCPALTPQGGARPPAHHSNFTPTSGAVIVGGVEMAASLPVVISCSRPRATCPYTAVADTGAQVSVAGRLLLGDLGISQRQLQATSTAVTHVAGGSMRFLGTITCQVSVGTVSTTECIYIAEGVQQLYLSLKACKALRLVHHTFPRPLSPTSVCAVEPSDTPQDTRCAESPPHELVEENVDRSRNGSWSTSGALCLPWDARRYQR